MSSKNIVIGWGWMARRKRPKRLEKKLRRRGYLRVIAKHREPTKGWQRWLGYCPVLPAVEKTA